METGGEARKGGGGPKNKPVSQSMKAGLQFPIGRIEVYLKQGRYAIRVGTGIRLLDLLPYSIRTLGRWLLVLLVLGAGEERGGGRQEEPDHSAARVAGHSPCRRNHRPRRVLPNFMQR